MKTQDIPHQWPYLKEVVAQRVIWHEKIVLSSPKNHHLLAFQNYVESEHNISRKNTHNVIFFQLAFDIQQFITRAKIWEHIILIVYKWHQPKLRQ